MRRYSKLNFSANTGKKRGVISMKFMMDLYGNGLLLGEKTLDSLWMRQNLTMNNIANVDTPGFKSQYMTFENELAQKIRSALTVKKTSMKNVARGIENMRPSVHTTLNESTRLDENNVDMDQEQVELARTAYEYQFMISSVSSDLSRLRSAAKNF